MSFMQWKGWESERERSNCEQSVAKRSWRSMELVQWTEVRCWMNGIEGGIVSEHFQHVLFANNDVVRSLKNVCVVLVQ